MNKQEAVEKAKLIDGWMDPPDLEFLYDAAHATEPGQKIVEVGPWLGRSTTVLVLGANTSDISVVDKWEGTVGEEEYFPVTGLSIRERFLENMKKINHVPAMIYDGSWEAADRFEDRSISLLFIDANHTEEFVYNDLMHWIPKVARGGIICGHDWYSKPGVPLAIRRIMAEQKDDVTDLRLVGCNIWAMRKV
jgi:predicted O-methyltransferase YrrM